MGFTEEFKKISGILEEKCNIMLNENQYNALIVKKMSATNCIEKDITSKQSHIAITGKQMNMFPYIYQKAYIEEGEAALKNFFVLKAPVNIFKNNCNYLEKGDKIDFGKFMCKQEEMCIYPRSGGDQVQLSMKENDSADFIAFRELIKPDDYLIVLKHKEVLKYDFFAVKNADAEEIFHGKSIFEYHKGKYTPSSFLTEENVEYKKVQKPYQRIFFGAPGTGKSFRLNQEAKDNFGDNYERVTFHPNYMYGNFIGAFKPFPELTGEKYDGGKDKQVITYRYVPGPFMRILVESLKNPERNYLLVIEEINRANTAAVFGDFFQLLDRDSLGESEYPIAVSEDLKKYLTESFKGCSDSIKNYIEGKFGEEYSRLMLPSNLYIWCTMNSADQGVMPMDTAFKRRWSFTYIGVDEALENPEIAERFKEYKFNIKDKVVRWDEFRREINEKLLNCGVPEDKLLGPFFLSRTILEKSRDKETCDEMNGAIENKVLMYLYEDAGKPFRFKIFNKERAKTYSQLCKNFKEFGEGIFHQPLDLKDYKNEIEDKSNKIIEISEKNDFPYNEPPVTSDRNAAESELDKNIKD